MDWNTIILLSLILLLFAYWVYIIYRNHELYVQALRDTAIHLEKKINRLARMWLLKHDPKYHQQWLGLEVVRLRKIARQRGASAEELDAINIYTVAEGRFSG